MGSECPECSYINNTQKFCGNCGVQLISDQGDTTAILKTPKKKRRWLRTIGLFLLIYLIGGVILQIILLNTGNDKYASGISFVVGLIIAAYYFMSMGEDDPPAQIK